MNKLYLLVLSVVFISCYPSVRYVGQSLTPTKKVDVFVARESIKRPFEFIGKGYVSTLPQFPNPEIVQQQAILVARKKGADAVLITDQYLVEPRLLTVMGNDSLSRARVTSSGTQVSSKLEIYFIRYSN